MRCNYGDDDDDDDDDENDEEEEEDKNEDEKEFLGCKIGNLCMFDATNFG